MGTVNPRGAHECGALGSAQGCAQSSAVPLVVAHRIERNPDWKVFLNMAAAAGALIHVRSAPQALTRAGGGRQEEWPGQVLVHVSQPALARLGLCRNAFSRWGLLVHVTTRSAGAALGPNQAHACGCVRVGWAAGSPQSRAPPPCILVVVVVLL